VLDDRVEVFAQDVVSHQREFHHRLIDSVKDADPGLAVRR